MEPDQNSAQRTNRILVAIAMLVGFGLRIWPIGQLGCNQFDEGIYWLAARWIFQPDGLGAIDPTLIAYAPPGLVILMGLAASVIGLSDQTGILVSVLCGTITIPVGARLGREIFGDQAGVTSAWCLCLAGPHIAFSRMGLTDATFVLAWSIGFWACLRFLRDPSLRQGLRMGLAVGLAQSIKYNGWLLGVFVILTVLLGLSCSTAERRSARWGRLVGYGGAGAIVAWLVVWPWFHFVEEHGGYADLLRHQRSYLGGYRVWWPHLIAQAHQAAALSGPAWLTVANVLAVMVSLGINPHTNRRWSVRDLIRLLSGAILLGSLLAAPATAGGLYLLTRCRLGRIEAKFLGLSWLTLFVLAPFYHPYARLWLPLEFLHWLILGGLTADFARWFDQVSPDLTRWSWPWWALPLIFAGVAGPFLVLGPGAPLAGRNSYSHAGLFDRSDSLRVVAGQIAQQIPPDVQVIRTLVRPALRNYLAASALLVPQPDLVEFGKNGPPQIWALVDSALLTGELTSNDPTPLRRYLAPLLDAWEIVGEFPVMTTLPTALDLEPMRPSYDSANSMACVWLLKPRSRSLAP